MVNRLTGLTHLNGLVLVSAAGLLVILGIAVLAGSVFCMIQSRSVGTGK